MKRLFVCENCGKIFMEGADGTVRSCFGYDMCSDQCANEFMNRKKGKKEMSENYIVINGKKAELTKEQLKALGIIEMKKNPFIVEEGYRYWYADSFAGVNSNFHTRHKDDKSLIDSCNAFNDSSFANQVALHQLLYRKLLKFAYDHDAVDKTWDGNNSHFFPYYEVDSDPKECEWEVAGSVFNRLVGVAYFATEDVARRAIEEVIRPFMREHPEFVW